MVLICIVHRSFTSHLCSCVFFFKQKTAYEMRISDWSSDVCSSDLRGQREAGEAGHEHAAAAEDVAEPAAGDQHHGIGQAIGGDDEQIGRASCRERVCQYV